MNTVSMTITPPDDPRSKTDKPKELESRLAEDSPQGEFLRMTRDTVRVEVFRLQPLCPECQESDPKFPESADAPPDPRED